MNALDKHTTDQPQVPEGRKGRDLVYGVGKTGLSVARFLKRIDTNAIYVDSRRQPPGLDDLKSMLPDAETILGIPESNILDDVQRIIVSPGISDRDPLLVDARAAGIDVVSDIELFVDNAAAPFVAVTGSNGKSTVTTLLALMCSASGKTALAGANLGEPALDLLTLDVPDIYLLELSSFQLQRTRHLPARVAVLLNISPDHLDWHIDEAEYRAAKYRVFREAEAAVWNRDDPHAASFLRDDQRQISFGLDAPAAGQYGLISDGGVKYLARGTERLVDSSTLALVGVHNRANALAAMAAGELLGLDTGAMLGVLQTFTGLPHRMQFVARHGGCDFINDSKATNVGAAIASVNSVTTPVVLIAGGQGKGGDFRLFADTVHRRLRAAVLIGEDADAIEEAIAGRVPVIRAGSLQSAVQEAARAAKPGDTILLAPACASFDQFENYLQRGDAFCAAVEALTV